MWSARNAVLWAAVGLVAIAPFEVRNAGAQDAAHLSGEGILARMAATYAHCRSYRDAGVVRIVYLESGGSRIEERPFRTAFVRPDRFRFEYTETGVAGATRRYIVHRLGARVQTWWDVSPGIEERESLEMALAGATGVSGGSAHTIPALLLPGELGGRRLTDMIEVKRLADEPCDGASCFRVEGSYAGSSRTVWVDQGTFLVRKIEFEETYPTFRTRQTTAYEPVADEQVRPELLQFDPPAQK